MIPRLFWPTRKKRRDSGVVEIPTIGIGCQAVTKVLSRRTEVHERVAQALRLFGGDLSQCKRPLANLDFVVEANKVGSAGTRMKLKSKLQTSSPFQSHLAAAFR